jgi:hypothetical protein
VARPPTLAARGVHDNAAGVDGGFDLVEDGCVTFERNSQYDEISRTAGCNIFRAGNIGGRTDFLFNFLCRFLGAFGIARSNDDSLSCLGPTQRQAEAFRACASDDCDGARAHLCQPHQANSGSSDCSMVNCSGCCLILIRV